MSGFIEGNVSTRSWEDNSVKKYTTEIVTREMLRSRAGGSSDFALQQQGGGAPQQSQGSHQNS